MADTEYMRLGCAAEACAGQHKAHGYCLRHYRQWQRGGVKKDAATCAHCGTAMDGKIAGSMYCGATCKRLAWRADNPDRSDEQKLCAYWAGHCSTCGVAMGGKRAQARCESCKRANELSASREAANAFNLARHKARALVVCCPHCDAEFCPLYGNKARRACPCCEPDFRREQERAHKALRDRRIKATKREAVWPSKVFKRDGWRCQLCGIETPKHLRGTYEHNAPELDHVVPLAGGGEHTYENTQCLCRSCNGWKGSRTMVEALDALAV